MRKDTNAKIIKCLRIIISIMLISLVISCTDGGSDYENGKGSQHDNYAKSESNLTQSFTTYKLSKIHMQLGEIENRIYTLAAMMNDDKTLSSPTLQAWNGKTEQGDVLFARPFENASNMFVSYDPEMNRLVLANDSLLSPELEVLDEFEKNPAGIGENSARIVMDKFLNRMEGSGIIKKSAYDMNAIHVGYRKTARGMPGEDVNAHQWIDEYLFTVRRQVEGIPIYGANIRVGVHRSGKISSIRFSDMDVTKTNKTRMERKASSEDITKRFYSEIPEKAEVYISRNEIAYVMQERIEEAEVEPMQIFNYSLIFQTEDNNEVVTRRYTRGYSLTSSEKSSVDLSPSDFGEKTKSDIK